MACGNQHVECPLADADFIYTFRRGDPIPEDEERLLIATGRFVGGGFEDVRLDTLFLTMLVSWRGTLAQYAARLHRMHSYKADVAVFDYLDGAVPMLARMFERRAAGYRAMG